MKDFGYIQLNDHRIDVPDWNRITKDQFLELIRLNMECESVQDFIVRACLVLTGLKIPVKQEVIRDGTLGFFMRYDDKEYLIQQYDLLTIFREFEKYFYVKYTSHRKGRDVVTYRFQPKITRNLLKIIKTKTGELAGPADALSNLKYNEFIHAESNLHKYMDKKDPFYLNKLIVTLYRPVDKRKDPHSIQFDGDLREPFNDFLLDERARGLRLDQVMKEAILIWYKGCKYQKAMAYPHVFQESAGGSLKLNVMKEHLGITNILSGGDPTKNEQIRALYLDEVLFSLNETMKFYKENQKKRK